MHPPFFFTDHRAGPDVHMNRPKARRSRPAVLVLTPVATSGLMTVRLRRFEDTPPKPVSRPVLADLRLQVVPPPRRTWKDGLGRWMIRTGQRMILGN